MSRTKPSNFETLALDLKCPHCRSWDWCTTQTGAWATSLHSRRTDPVRHAWSAGYVESEGYSGHRIANAFRAAAKALIAERALSPEGFMAVRVWLLDLADKHDKDQRWAPTRSTP